jgi:hypothetical protein
MPLRARLSYRPLRPGECSSDYSIRYRCGGRFTTPRGWASCPVARRGRMTARSCYYGNQHGRTHRRVKRAQCGLYQQMYIVKDKGTQRHEVQRTTCYQTPGRAEAAMIRHTLTQANGRVIPKAERELRYVHQFVWSPKGRKYRWYQTVKGPEFREWGPEVVMNVPQLKGGMHLRTNTPMAPSFEKRWRQLATRLEARLAGQPADAAPVEHQ